MYTYMSFWIGFRPNFSVSEKFLSYNEWSGLAATNDAWGPQIRGLTGSDMPNGDDATMVGDGYDNEAGYGGDGIEVCAFDNRGMGRSSVPTKKSEYTWVLNFFLEKFFDFLVSYGFYLLFLSGVDFKWASFFFRL